MVQEPSARLPSSALSPQVRFPPRRPPGSLSRHRSLMPLAVVGGGLYVWVSGDRIWNAVDEGTRTAVAARFATATTAVGWGNSDAVNDQP